MSISVGIHPPKTPVTSGSNGIAKVTTPNVCKMPGPPAPFVPSPLPNIGKSGNSPKDYSKTVEIESCKVAIRGATFESMGDMASKGTGGGLISANTHGPTKFITPGSLTVKIEGKSVHLLGEPMLNNCAASGTPPNTGATLAGEDQGNQNGAPPDKHDIKCAIQKCDQKDENGDDYDVGTTAAGVPMPAGAQCSALGSKKHSCVKRTLEAKNPNCQCEQTFNMNNSPPTPHPPGAPQLPAGQGRRPDVVVGGPPPGSYDVYDAKFPCSAAVKAGTTAGPMPSMSRTGASMMGNSQRRAYGDIANGGNVEPLSPSDCAKEVCE